MCHPGAIGTDLFGIMAGAVQAGYLIPGTCPDMNQSTLNLQF